MKIGFFVNRIENERSEYTTTRLASASDRLGHRAYYLDVDSFIYRQDEHLSALARSVPSGERTLEGLLAGVQDGRDEKIDVADLDVLFMRAESEMEFEDRPWAPDLGVEFGLLAAEHGVLVVNDPLGLAKASSKLYLQSFPKAVRPRSLISRDRDEIKSFIEDQGGTAVVKPFRGSKGDNVFLIRPEEDANVNQMIDAVLRDGYVIAQEFLPEADEGDVRVLLVDGELLEAEGHPAAFRRRPPERDLRSNMSAGGKAEPATVDDTIANVIAQIGPKLRADGLFFVGIDVMAGKVLEINAESPGGLGSTSRIAGVDFSAVVIEKLATRLADKSGREGDRSSGSS